MNKLSQNVRLKMKSLGLTQADLAEKAGVAQPTIHRLLSGKIATTTKLVELAQALQCDVEWLLTGESEALSNIEPATPMTKGLYPVISWVQAGDWSQIYEISQQEAEHYPCPVKCSDKTFLLRVRGMSMSPTFNEGELIFIDPEVEATNGKFVVARLDDENEATFKKLVVEGEHRFLKAENPAWPTPIQPINGNCSIVGVVIFAGRSF